MSTEAAEAVTEVIVDAPAADDSGIDMKAAVDEISGSLGLSDDTAADDTSADDAADAAAAPTSGAEDDAAAAAKAAATAERPFPKSWAKETEELWKSIPDAAKAQIEKREQQMLEGLTQYKEFSEIGRTLKAAIDPYQADLQAQGVDAPKAVSYLLSVNRRLTQGPVESRQAAYAELGRNLGFTAAPAAEPGKELDPEIKALKETVTQLQSTMTERQQKEFDQHKATVAKSVNEFAEANPYFDEVADDMAPFLKAGADLKTAYEKAVWANPVTRAKEIARTQAESTANLLKKSKDEAEAARRASSTNVRTRDSNKAPTEPKAKLFSEGHDEEMRQVIRNAGKRTH